MITQITPRELATRLANDHPTTLLDVRQPWEHEIAAIEGSRLIPLSELATRSGELGEVGESLVVVYCHHGMRSLNGGNILLRLGFRNVASLAGGIDAWSCEVDPTVKRY